MEILSLAKDAYDKDGGSEPIRMLDYVALLDAFEFIIEKLEISAAYETDFRRNLPAGGWRGLHVAPTLSDRIVDVRRFLESRPVYGPTGSAILDNLAVCVYLCRQQHVDAEQMLASIKPTLTRVARGDLR